MQAWQLVCRLYRLKATGAKVDASTLVGYFIPRQAASKTKNPLIFNQGNVKIECLGKV
ncbi:MULTISPECIES: hypothetical protein [Nostoc]|uniref:Uncharacterized protein n=2 Tax=Nostoc TaxID=1177 RepID=A0ABR8I856_9NOSO|nr:MULTISPECIES: hypothetical protein [Nostoc]MBD2560343.1 hypothetical protein [Nostoc linckia FACHB-391]MBD2646848.1 hypothetical protein [Nostoc foliaceum FACHB-393]